MNPAEYIILAASSKNVPLNIANKKAHSFPINCETVVDVIMSPSPSNTGENHGLFCNHLIIM